MSLRQLSDLQTHQQSWYSYIEARKALIQFNEQPIAIKSAANITPSADEWKVELEQVNSVSLFYESARQTLRLRESDIREKEGLFCLPWNTTVTEGTLNSLKQTAETCYMEFEPAPMLKGTIGSWFEHPDLVKAKATSLLQQAGIAFPWNIVKAECQGEASNHQTDLEIVLMVNLDSSAMSTAERNAKRWAHAEARMALTRILTSHGFVARGVKASLVTSRFTRNVWASSFSQLVQQTWVADLVEQEHVKICQLRYCFQTSAGEKSSSGLLEEIGAELRLAFPRIQPVLSANSLRLEFQYYLDFSKRTAQVLRLRNLLDTYQDRLEQVGLVARLFGTDQLHFLARPDQRRQQEDAATRFSKLAGEEVGIGEDKNYQKIGKLARVQFPFLTIALAPEIDVETRLQLYKKLIAGNSITPNLTGEREKLARLSDALRRMTDPKKSVPNPQLRAALFDAAQARAVSEPAELNVGSATWQEVAQHSFLRLNESQHASVVATLLAPDMALVQGPPGTGKSTAISQIIWHLVRQNPLNRILLTSETNTAVDNALEKLENGFHNLVKPIRIGSEAKMEEEGGRYALTRLEEWATAPTEAQSGPVDQSDNILRRWMRTIARRATAQALLPTELTTAWTAALDDLAPATRAVVLKHYLENVNVIGATGGSLGEKSTRSTPIKPVYTKFFRQYRKVFAERLTATEVSQKNSAKNSGKGSSSANTIDTSGIRFDVVVMDEASKATPPELALALVYAYKAIIIGDHRQLPPLLDEGDFRSTLLAAGAPELAARFSRADAETSQFERLFTRPGVQPGVVSRFDTQYRMHPDINAVIEQFYVDDNGLKCGIPEAAADEPNLSSALSRYHGLTHPVLVSPSDHLIWVEVDEPELLAGTSRINPSEVQATEAVLACLSQSQGFEEFQAHWTKPEEREVALITFYGRQVNLLQEVAAQFSDTIPCRVQTVDKFQGMERNIVVVSLVRSDKIAATRFQEPDLEAYPASGGYPLQPSLGFAQFPNRLNVALSRAKRLLIIVGNSRHFSRNDCYRRVYETVQARGRVVPYADLLPYLKS
ncbi:AAA domain-containing protein [Hymenobacter sp. UYP22]|uniref:DEAD/DEAH box helicase n=1 Tax=Hymenobacter sp. UYP22 TaxID=3156348 RepID=UPI003390E7D1